MHRVHDTMVNRMLDFDEISFNYTAEGAKVPQLPFNKLCSFAHDSIWSHHNYV